MPTLAAVADPVLSALDRPELDEYIPNPESLAERIKSVIAKHSENDKNMPKVQMRSLHEQARLARLGESQEWIQKAWAKHSHRFADGSSLSPEHITPKLIQVETSEHYDLFRLARFTWSLPYSRGYGRRLRFIVIDEHHGTLMGVLGLQSAPIGFAPRDRRVMYPTKERKETLVNQTMDIFTLGAIPPYNRLLAGKMMVYAAGSREISQAYRAKYADATTLMKDRVLPPHLVMLTTTSAYGRSSIYNRVTYPDRIDAPNRAIATELGYTEGYGNFHFDAVYPDIKDFLIKQGIPANVGFGRGPKPAWQNITRTLTMLGIDGNGLKHGIQRQAWCIPLARNAWEYLNGEAEEPDYYETTYAQLMNWWKERWLLPRAQRISDWRDWRKESVLESLTVSRYHHVT